MSSTVYLRSSTSRLGWPSSNAHGQSRDGLFRLPANQYESCEFELQLGNIVALTMRKMALALLLIVGGSPVHASAEAPGDNQVLTGVLEGTLLGPVVGFSAGLGVSLLAGAVSRRDGRTLGVSVMTLIGGTSGGLVGGIISGAKGGDVSGIVMRSFWFGLAGSLIGAGDALLTNHEPSGAN